MVGGGGNYAHQQNVKTEIVSDDKQIKVEQGSYFIKNRKFRSDLIDEMAVIDFPGTQISRYDSLVFQNDFFVFGGDKDFVNGLPSDEIFQFSISTKSCVVSHYSETKKSFQLEYIS